MIIKRVLKYIKIQVITLKYNNAEDHQSYKIIT